MDLTNIDQENVEALIFRCSRAANSVVHDQIKLNFEHIQVFMYVIVLCKYEKDLIKNQLRKLRDTFFPNMSLWRFFLTLKGR